MKFAAFVAALALSVPAAAQTRASAPDKIGEAYDQFLLAHRLEQRDDVNGAIAAYKRAMALDPTASEVPAELAAFYLRQNRAQDAMGAAEQAIAIEPANREANRVLGIIYAATAEASRTPAAGDEALQKAIHHLELAVERPAGEPDPNVRATLSRLYIRAKAFDKAIPVLSDLVTHEPGWQDGPLLLVEAYVGAGRLADATAWLETAVADDPRLLPSLADLYERQRRWKDAITAYAGAVERNPRNLDLNVRYASALLNVGGAANILKARDLLRTIVASPTRANDTRSLYLLSQAERRSGDAVAAEASARKVIAAQGRSPWGYYALAEALESRRDYREVIEVLTPALATFRAGSDNTLELGLLLPHLGFAQREVGDFDASIATFDEAHHLAPDDPSLTGYLIEAYLAGKKYGNAIDLARQARGGNPTDLRFSRLEAQALKQSGKPDEGLAVLEDTLKQHGDQVQAYLALAQMYADTSRGPQAVKVLQDAGEKFPADTTVLFELGAVYDRQKKYSDAEGAFRQLLSREPANAAALNYLGYMLAERGERLDESVDFVKKALEVDPDNGSYLDSLGWAYYKSDKLDLAEPPLRRAADQLKDNSVIQAHLGDLLLKLGRYDEAIAAFTRALAGDGDAIDRGDIDKKIKAAKQKINKK